MTLIKEYDIVIFVIEKEDITMKMSKKQKKHFKELIGLIRTANTLSDNDVLLAFDVDKKTAINNILSAMERDLE